MTVREKLYKNTNMYDLLLGMVKKGPDPDDGYCSLANVYASLGIPWTCCPYKEGYHQCEACINDFMNMEVD